MASSDGALDLVLDIGKTRSKLFVLDRDGQVVASADRANAGVDAQLGPARYLALDTQGIGAWLEQALLALGPLRERLARAVVSGHGAGVAAVDGDELAWPVPDYEFTGFDQRADGWAQSIGSFEETQSPDLPRGLNLATQLDWLERHAGGPAGRGTLLPWAQYWAWWLCGVAASEAGSLGCHTHLWRPTARDWSALAQRRGWAGRFAPVRPAWQVLGPVRAARAAHLGLPPGLQVCTGVHDSNACLARYLRSQPRMTLVTTGTWVVVMAPGAPPRALDPARDLLGNVSVRGQPLPTGRFMGGREVQALCAGADPALAHADALRRLLAQGVMALPGFEPQGGPFRDRSGTLCDAEGARVALDALAPAERATLAALYAAQVTAWLVDALGGAEPVVVEGPFAANAVYTGALAALRLGGVHVSTDALEGTARGAWMLAHWTEPSIAPPAIAPASPLAPDLAAGVAALHARWCAALAAPSAGAAGREMGAALQQVVP